MMGVWFLSSAFAAYAGGLIAGAMAIDTAADGSAVDAVTSLGVYVTVFEKLAWAAVILGVLVLIASPFLHKRMHGVH